MECKVSKEQLWSWIDRNAPELEAHLAECPRCRALASQLRVGIATVVAGCASAEYPLPERVGDYAIRRRLGEGGQAIVYEAEQRSPRRPVALKVLKGGHFAGERDVRYFQREIQSLASLQHAAIATIYEAGHTDDGQHYLAMELVRGQPLDAYVRDRALELPPRLELFCKVCDAVHYAHQHGVVHRDLKPSNILVDAEGSPKILDFGLARVMDTDILQSTSVTQPGQILGTLAYMSPEQACGRPEEINARSDVYSLGVILYELLTDKHPYELCRLFSEAVRTICEQAPRKPSSLRRGLAGDLQTVALKALEKEPARRYSSVAELRDDVQRYLRGEPIRARPPSALYVLRKRVARHRLAVLTSLVVLAVGLGAVGAREWWRAREGGQRRAAVRRTALNIQRAIEAGRAKIELEKASALFAEYPDVPECGLVWAQARFRVALEVRDEPLVGTVIFRLRDQMASSPVPWAYHALLVEIYDTWGSPQAEELRDQPQAQVPDTAEAWYLLSFATLDPGTAARFASEAVRCDAEYALAWERLAYLWLHTGEYESALQATDRLINLGLDREQWSMHRADILVMQRHYQEAFDLYTCVVAEFRSSDAYRRRAIVQLCLRNYEGALADYTTAIEERAGDLSFLRRQRANPLWMTGRLDEAVQEYRAFRARYGYPDYADARLFLILHEKAQQLRQEGRAADAADALRDARVALETGRRAAVRGSWLDRILACLGGEIDPDALVASADRRNPEEVCEGYYYAGEVCLLEGRRDEARQWFEKCVQTGLVFDRDQIPPDPMSEYHLAGWRLDRLIVVDNAASKPASTPSGGSSTHSVDPLATD